MDFEVLIPGREILFTALIIPLNGKRKRFMNSEQQVWNNKKDTKNENHGILVIFHHSTAHVHLSSEMRRH